MKAGLAVMIHLIETLDANGIVGVFYAGEEGPMSGNQLGPILEQLPILTEAMAAIVLEPTNRELQAGCNGAINATVSFLGEPAHSARPWLGVNAVTRAGGFLQMMDSLEPQSHILGGLEFFEVISVTRAAGGVANNVIPGRFDINVNYRFAPDRPAGEALEELARVCEEADVIEITDAAPAAVPDVSHELFSALAKAGSAEVKPKQGWTDVAQFASRGVPAANFGPGETDLAHKPGESVRIDDLAWAYDALLEVLDDLR
jgi:succinyl-diaminopimelate desuccinylase